MAYISVEEAKPGVVLEDNVTNSHGQLLVAAGTNLTERHLTLLRSWGVTQVPVCGNVNSPKDATQDREVSPAIYKKAEEALRSIFILVSEDDTVMQELFRQCLARKIRLLS